MILNALDEVLFWDDIPLLKAFTKENIAKFYPHDSQEYYRAKDEFLKSHIPDKAEFAKRMENYCFNGSAVWVSGRNQLSDDITYNDLIKAIRKNATVENGKKKADMADSFFEKDEAFWKYYAENILYTSKNTVCELTVGAGLGTAAVMRGMCADDLYMGVDIDFCCAKNADAIAKYYGVNGLGIASSLWNMPFEYEMFSAVCSNMGLEECREVPTVIAEASRILRIGGKMVLHCVENKKSLWYSYFEKYGFTDEEARYWLRKARLYSDIEQISESAEKCGLKLTDKRFDDAKGHIFVFEKQ